MLPTATESCLPVLGLPSVYGGMTAHSVTRKQDLPELFSYLGNATISEA